MCSVDIAVETSIIDSQRLLEIKNVTTVPGEVYPETGLRLVDIKSLNDELFSRYFFKERDCLHADSSTRYAHEQICSCAVWSMCAYS
jgi:hypothetical protein